MTKLLNIIFDESLIDDSILSVINSSNSGLDVSQNDTDFDYIRPYRSELALTVSISVIVINVIQAAYTIFKLLKDMRSRNQNNNVQISIEINNKVLSFSDQDESEIRERLKEAISD